MSRCKGLYAQWPKQCCCKCQHQVEIGCHPWNKRKPFKGPCNQWFGWGCAVESVIDAKIKKIHTVTFRDTEHGLCELFYNREEKR